MVVYRHHDHGIGNIGAARDLERSFHSWEVPNGGDNLDNHVAPSGHCQQPLKLADHDLRSADLE